MPNLNNEIKSEYVKVKKVITFFRFLSFLALGYSKHMN